MDLIRTISLQCVAVLTIKNALDNSIIFLLFSLWDPYWEIPFSFFTGKKLYVCVCLCHVLVDTFLQKSCSCLCYTWKAQSQIFDSPFTKLDGHLKISVNSILALFLELLCHFLSFCTISFIYSFISIIEHCSLYFFVHFLVVLESEPKASPY